MLAKSILFQLASAIMIIIANNDLRFLILLVINFLIIMMQSCRSVTLGLCNSSTILSLHQFYSSHNAVMLFSLNRFNFMITQ